MSDASRAFAAFALLLLAAFASAETIRVAGNRIFVPVTIEGVRTEALLDSGAEMTLLDAAFARRLALTLEGGEVARGTGGEQNVQFARGLAIESAGIGLENVAAAVLDLTDVARRLVGEPVTMVLGRELFDSGRFVLDIGRQRFEHVGEDHTPAGKPLPLGDHRGIEQFPIGIEGIGTWAGFDTGNGSEMLVGRTSRGGTAGSRRSASPAHARVAASAARSSGNSCDCSRCGSMAWISAPPSRPSMLPVTPPTRTWVLRCCDSS